MTNVIDDSYNKVNCNKVDNNNAGDNYVHSIVTNKVLTKMVNRNCFTKSKLRKIIYDGNDGDDYSKD